MAMVPEISREAPALVPNSSAASAAARRTAGLVGEPQVVVGAEEQDRPAVQLHRRAPAGLR